MQVVLLYKYETRVGVFYIGQTPDGRYHPIFRDESLGSYAQAWQAAEDLAGGHTFSATGVQDTSTLGIPSELVEWQQMRSLQRE